MRFLISPLLRRTHWVLVFRSEQDFDLFHIRMSNARHLELIEVIQHHLAKSLLTVAKFSVLVFQVDGLRFVELVIEKITVGEFGFDEYCLIRRELQSFERSGNRLPRFSIEKLIPSKGQVVVSVFRIQFNGFLYILDRVSILLLLGVEIAADRIRNRFFAAEFNHAVQVCNRTVEVAASKFGSGAGEIKAWLLRSELNGAGEISDRAVKVALR